MAGQEIESDQLVGVIRSTEAIAEPTFHALFVKKNVKEPFCVKVY